MIICDFNLHWAIFGPYETNTMNYISTAIMLIQSNLLQFLYAQRSAWVKKPLQCSFFSSTIPIIQSTHNLKKGLIKHEKLEFKISSFLVVALVWHRGGCIVQLI